MIATRRWSTLVAVGLVAALLGLIAPGAAEAKPGKPPKPVVTGLSVSSGSSVGGTKVTIRGKNLKGATKVTFGGVRATQVKVVSATKIMAVAPRSDVGTVPVQVTTKGGTSKKAGKASFTYKTYSTIANGYYHTCRLQAGAVQCVGYNSDGQLGDGTTTNRATWTPVTGLSGSIIAISSTDYTTCALRAAGTVACWGDNSQGQLGDGTTTDRLTPVNVGGLTGVVQLVSGYYQTCAVKADRSAWCWGDNAYGQLGNGTTTDSTAPVRVLGPANVVQIDADYYFTCLRRTTGKAYCMGHNDYGQLGNGTTTNSSTPVRVAGLTGVTDIATAFYNGCAAAAGRARCWGYNGTGELGDGTLTDSLTATTVQGLTGVTDVHGGGDFNCAIARGSAFCWGETYYGQLGDGSALSAADDEQPTPAAVISGHGVTEFSTGPFNGCYRKPTQLVCWGYNSYGQVGDGTTDDTSTPVNAN